MMKSILIIFLFTSLYADAKPGEENPKSSNAGKMTDDCKRIEELLRKMEADNESAKRFLAERSSDEAFYDCIKKLGGSASCDELPEEKKE